MSGYHSVWFGRVRHLLAHKRKSRAACDRLIRRCERQMALCRLGYLVGGHEL